MDKDYIKGLVGVYFQTSRAYRHVTRFPKGKTGMEEFHREYLWLDKLSSGDLYLRVYAPRKDRLQLEPEEFEYYRSVGGGTYF